MRNIPHITLTAYYYADPNAGHTVHFKDTRLIFKTKRHAEQVNALHEFRVWAQDKYGIGIRINYQKSNTEQFNQDTK